jgi:hypothetical protein
MRARKREQFDGEIKAAFDFIKDAIKDGKRTIGIFDVAVKLERENDPRWMNRIQILFSEFVDALNRLGVAVIPVNRYCLNHYRDVPVTDDTAAMRCVQLRSGGAAPAGIRCVRVDDKVYQAHLKAQTDLSSGALVANIRSLRSAEALGLVEEHSAMRVASQSVKRFVDAAALPSTPVQARLCES